MIVDADYELGRYEFKYALPHSARAQIIGLLHDRVQPDPHARPLDVMPGARGYVVHSMYFDTARLDDYFGRLDEHRIRDRLRVRTYGKSGDGAPLFLENKRKYLDRVVKNRVRLCNAEQWAACDSPHPWLVFGENIPARGQYTVRDFDRLVRYRRRAPVSVVHYQREVWVDSYEPASRVRLTLDHHVSTTAHPSMKDLYAAPTHRLLPADWMVLELKYDGARPGWMQDLARALRLRSGPVSKFGLSVAHTFRADHPNEIRYLTPFPLRGVHP